MIDTLYGVGVYAPGQATEAHCLLTPPRHWAGRRGVIWCHGANRTALDGLAAGYADIPRAVAQDAPTLYADLGGLYTWGNDASQNRTTDARTFLQARGAAQGKVTVLAGSMGASVACRWVRNNPTLVHKLGLFIPSVDVERMRAQDVAGLQDEIETAWVNNAAWQVARPTANPIEIADDLAALGIPIKVWYSTNDNLALPGEVATFAAICGAELVSLGAVGHDVTGIDLKATRAWATT